MRLLNSKINTKILLSLFILILFFGFCPIKVLAEDQTAGTDYVPTPLPDITSPTIPTKQGMTDQQWVTVNKNCVDLSTQNINQLQEQRKQVEQKLSSYKSSWLKYTGIAQYLLYRHLISGAEENLRQFDEKIGFEQVTGDHCQRQLDEANNDQAAIQQDISKNAAYIKKQVATIQADPNSTQSLRENISVCSLNPINFKLGNCIQFAIGWIGNIVMGVFGLLLVVAGKIFDFSVYLSISLLHSLFAQPAVANVWRVARDLANIFFVFILLYIAIGTVFELPGMGDTRKLIVGVIISALLVNFSGFFTRVIIDASNVIAYEFYSQMGGEGATYKSIGTKLIYDLRLDAYLTKDPKNMSVIEPQITSLSFFGVITQTFGNIIIILVASFVLLTASILFLIRTIYLIFLYIFSPLAFMSRMIPSGKFNYFDKWLSALVKQSFMAAGFLVPLYIVFRLLGTGGIVDLISGGGPLALPMIDAIIIGLLISCIFIANQFGAAGAKWATAVAGGATLLGAKGASKIVKYGGYGVAKAGMAAGKVAGTPGRRLSQWAKNVDIYDPRTSSTKQAAAMAVTGINGFGERIAGSVSKTASSAWDSKPGKNLRKSAFGKKVGDIVKNPLLNANEAIVGLATMSGGAGAYSFLGKTSKERKDADKEAKDAEKDAKEKKEKEKKDKLKEKEEQLKTAPSAQAFTILDSMTDSEITDLSEDVLKRDEVSENLTNSNFVSIQKAGKLSRATKAAIKAHVLSIPAGTMPVAPAGPGDSGRDYMTVPHPGATLW